MQLRKVPCDGRTAETMAQQCPLPAESSCFDVFWHALPTARPRSLLQRRSSSARVLLPVGRRYDARRVVINLEIIGGMTATTKPVETVHIAAVAIIITMTSFLLGLYWKPFRPSSV